MKHSLDDSKPIYLQIKEQLEDAIVEKRLQTGDRVPSTNEFASFYKINPATAAKGINELVQEDVLFKRRGVGMFVKEDARQKLVANRRKSFYKNYILPLKNEAEKLDISEEELFHMLKGENL